MTKTRYSVSPLHRDQVIVVTIAAAVCCFTVSLGSRPGCNALLLGLIQVANTFFASPQTIKDVRCLLCIFTNLLNVTNLNFTNLLNVTVLFTERWKFIMQY